MDRRHLVLALTGLPFIGTAKAGRQPYRVSLIGGAPEAETFTAAVVIDLDEGWKTYWRMPGDSGVPPVFDWSKSTNLKAAEVRYPVPMRYQDQSGETIGFKNRAVFPVIVTASDSSAPVRLDLHLFLGVCKEICIPVQARSVVDLAFRSPEPAEQGLVAEWLARVPVISTGLVRRAWVDNSTLRLTMSEPVDDIFVESTTSAYFREPQFSADGGQASLPIDGLKNPSVLKPAILRLTFRRGTGGFEQTVTVE